MGELFAGIDSGTQGTKVIIIDEKKEAVVGEGYEGHSLITNENGGREQHPEEWFAALLKAFKKACSSSKINVKDIKAIGISGQQHGFVPLDRNGRVIRPAKLWCDTETAEEADYLTKKMGGADAALELTGNSVAVGYTASKILWLKKHEPEKYADLSTMLLPHDYLNFRLTGNKKAEYGDASGTAYFDIRKRDWSEEALRAIDAERDLSECLPELIQSDEPAGTVLPEVAEELGLTSDVLVSSGSGDNMMAAIGTGNVAPGIVTASFGTSGTIYCFSEKPIVDNTGELGAFCSGDGHWLPLVCTMNVTVATELTRTLFEQDIEQFTKEAGKAQTGSGGIMLVPYFNGERTPPLPNAKALMYGMDTDNYTKSNLCRAAMEGAAFGMRYALDVMRRNGIEPMEIRMTGGGAKSRLWRQIAADMFRCPVVTPVIPEAGALGAALQAVWCYYRSRGSSIELAGITDRFVRLNEENRAEPDKVSSEKYDSMYEDYLKIHAGLHSFWK